MNPKNRPAGYTLIETLVVLGLLIALLSIGLVSLSGLLERSTLKQAQHNLTSLCLFARQTAISRQTFILLEIVAINDNTSARTTPPQTPYLTQDEDEFDKVRLCVMKNMRDPDSGAMRSVLTTEVLKEIILPHGIVFDDTHGTQRNYPKNEALTCDLDANGILDEQSLTKIFLQFAPDGSCRASGDTQTISGSTSTHLRLKDLSTKETRWVYVFPNTGSVKTSQ